MGIRACYGRFTGFGVGKNSHERYLCQFCFAFLANIESETKKQTQIQLLYLKKGILLK